MCVCVFTWDREGNFFCFSFACQRYELTINRKVNVNQNFQRQNFDKENKFVCFISILNEIEFVFEKKLIAKEGTLFVIVC